MVSGRPHIPKRSEELTVAAVGGNFSKSSKTTVSGTISLKEDTASSSVVEAVVIEEAEARVRERELWELKRRVGGEQSEKEKVVDLVL